jgi:hypothetical protein
VDEKLEELLKYFKHRFLNKVVMGLKKTWKERRAQKIIEYIKKKMEDWEAKAALAWSRLPKDGILCTMFFAVFHFYKVFFHHSHGHTIKKRQGL